MWNSNTLATCCKELMHWKSSCCWERLKVGGEGDDRGWDGWMASLTRWTWVWVISRSWWWTGNTGVLHSMGCKELNTTEQLNWAEFSSLLILYHSDIENAPCSNSRDIRLKKHPMLKHFLLVSFSRKPPGIWCEWNAVLCCHWHFVSSCNMTSIPYWIWKSA